MAALLANAHGTAPAQTQKAFMDGIYSVCNVADAGVVINVFGEAAVRAGMELHPSKVQIMGAQRTSSQSTSRSTTSIA